MRIRNTGFALTAVALVVMLVAPLRAQEPEQKDIVDTAIAAMKLGAYDYLTKPCKVQELDIVVRRAFEKRQLAQENIRLATRLERREEFPEIVTASAVMEEVLELARKVAAKINLKSSNAKGVVQVEMITK